jgi:hypothetical protein
MITERDFVVLPFTSDLSSAGLVYARRVLARSRAAGSSNSYDALRRNAASGAVNLALRRHLVEQRIPFGVQRATPFLDPERYDLQLGGRACELKVYLISRRAQWQALTEDPELALDAPALVPLDRHTTETVRGRDLYLFAFVGAGVGKQAQHGLQANAPDGGAWMHLIPRTWNSARAQAALGIVALEMSGTESTTLGFVAADLSGAPEEPNVVLATGKSVELERPLLALHGVYSDRRPSGRVLLRAGSGRLVHAIEPSEWHDVRLHGWGIILLGWITRQMFRTSAKLIPPGRRVFQFDRTKTKNLGVAVANLKPVADLLDSVKNPQPLA